MNKEEQNFNNSENPKLGISDVSNSYCVKMNMFFAVTEPIIEDSLTKEQADVLCKKLNDEELDDTYVWYTVHNCC